VLSASRDLADYFEACVKLFPKPKPVSNWIMGPLQGLLNTKGIHCRITGFPHSALAELLNWRMQGVISNKIAKTVFEEMAATNATGQSDCRKKGSGSGVRCVGH
jgi:aspartyl-tRNA(Asn)/glutamyl-tRNA(Gln) amidotransferase subunit B